MAMLTVERTMTVDSLNSRAMARPWSAVMAAPRAIASTTAVHTPSSQISRKSERATVASVGPKV